MRVEALAAAPPLYVGGGAAVRAALAGRASGLTPRAE